MKISRRKGRVIVETGGEELSTFVRFASLLVMLMAALLLLYYGWVR